MRKFLLLLLTLFFSSAMFANTSVTMNLADNGINQKDAITKISQVLNCSRTEFVVLNEREDQLGMTHIALQQTLDGTPINGAMILLHCKDGVAMSLNGQYVPDEQLPLPVKAISKSKARMKAGAPKQTQLALVIIETKDGKMRWAYETVNIKKQLKVWVDAETGEILRRVPFLRSLSDVEGTANTLYMGEIPMTSVLTDDGDYVLFDEGRKIYTYDASHWEIPLLTELINGLDGDEEEEEEELDSAEITAGITAAFDQMITSSKEYRSLSADWNQKEIRQVTIEFFDEQWAVENIKSPFFCAILFDKNNQVKEDSGVIDVENLLEEEEENEDEFEEEDEEEYENSLTLPFLNVCSLDPTDVVQIYNVVMDDNKEEVISANLLAEFSVGDAMVAEDNTLNDKHLSCQMDIYNGPWLDVHVGMQAIYDYYKKVFGRDSYDGKGTPIRQFVNVPHDEDQFEAFPLNACALGMRNFINQVMPGAGDYGFDFMAYGAGDGKTISSLVSFDVLAHEFTHLVTTYRGIGDLEYKGESGALNEAISDIMACAIGHTSGLDTNWVIGEEVMLPRGTYMRSMEAPKLGQDGQDPQPDTYGGEYWADIEDEDDNGGVHTNSGVINHWYYLLCEGGNGINDLGYSYNLKGMGIEKATTIVFNSLLYGFTPTATFQDACDATVLMAQQIYGADEAIATADAWKAVGLSVTTGIISGINDATCQDNVDSPCYNLQGIPVNDNYKGIVIQKGQKSVRQ